MDVVEIGDEGPGIVDFPCRCDVIEVAKRGVRVAAARRDVIDSVIGPVGIGNFRPDMSGRHDREVAVEQIEANAAVERRMGNVDASEGRVHAGGDAGIDID